MSRTSKRPSKSTRKNRTTNPMDVESILPDPVSSVSAASSSAAAAAAAPPVAIPKPTVVEDKTEPIMNEKVLRRRGKRTAVDRTMVEQKFDEFIGTIESNLSAPRDSALSTKEWKAMVKQAKQLKSQSLRIAKKPKRASRESNSGFMKPAAITREMAEFAGWDANELKSRVDVTRVLCKYIKENHLQNPENRRQILPDAKLSSLLQLQAGEELTFLSLQKQIKPLFNPSN
jgi:hypothetical protein